ncbi:hypothetical protein [Streptomyces violascens]|uniref:hypothetical protein n=1 Tax=Streptomyces violascens TaxID=67381 RepID=UPI0036C86C6F
MFSLADPVGTRALLSAAGFANAEVASAEAYGIWGRDAEDATGFLLGSGPACHLLGQVDDDTQEHARQS